MRLRTGSSLYIHAAPFELRNYTTERYCKWWEERHGDYLKYEIETLSLESRPAQRKSQPAAEEQARESFTQSFLQGM